MRKECILRLDQEINYLTGKQLNFVYSIMAFLVIMISTVLFGKISQHKKHVGYFLVPIAANVPSLGTSGERAKKQEKMNCQK